MAVYFDNSGSAWDTLAVNLIGGLIGDAIQRSREANQNRKINAAIGEALSRGNNVDLTGGFASMPEGYNNDGWQQSFHKTGSPVEQFDIGLANFVPKQQATPSGWDMMQNFAQVLAQPRFSMVNRENAEKLFNPYLEQAERMRIEQLKNNAAENFAKAQNPLLAAQQGVINGTIPNNVLTSVQQQNQFDKTFNDLSAYQREQIRQSDEQRALQRYMFDNPSAGQKLQNNQYYDKLNQDDRHFQQGRDDSLYIFNTEQDYKKSKDAQAQANWEAEQKIQKENELWNRGYKDRVLDATNQQNAEKRISTAIEQTDKDIATLQEILEDETNEANRKAYINQIQVLQIKKRELVNQLGSLYNQPEQNKTKEPVLASVIPTEEKQNKSDHLASAILGKKATPHEKGTFNYPRTKNGKAYNHKGVDYPMNEGTPVTIDERMGNNLKVTRVFNTAKKGDQEAGGGYGNFVEIAGNLGNRKVRFLMAHLKEGSVNLRVGDSVNAGQVVGAVGSTGHSTGNHLHLECYVDGERVDPETFLSKYGMQPISPNTGVADFSNEQNNKSQPQKIDKTSVRWKNKNTGETITNGEYNAMLDEIRSGKRNIKSEDEFRKSLIEKDWEETPQKEYPFIPFISSQVPQISKDNENKLRFYDAHYPIFDTGVI